MDYHITVSEMDLARQMRDMNLQWPFGTGDHFCTPDNKMMVCLGVEGQGEQASVASHDGRFPLNNVSWLPKRTQAIEWLTEREWKLVIHTTEKSTTIEARNHKYGVAEGFGRTELEALYDTMIHVLELQEEG